MVFMQYVRKVTHNWYIQKVFDKVIPPAAQSEDGRDQWPSRTAFLLAAMGGCAGQGNLIR